MGMTDREGKLRLTYWLRTYFGLLLEEPYGTSLQWYADKILLSGATPEEPLLVYMGKSAAQRT
jgi:hypothetical protein